MRADAALAGLALALTITPFAAPGALAQTAVRPPTMAAELSRALEATTRLVTPAVVEIFTTTYAAGEGLVPHTADLVTTRRGSGSGVIVDPSGYIVTNAHVVRGAQRVRVEVPRPTDGQSILAARSHTFDARILGVDPETDLAVLKIEETNLPVLAFGDSDDLQSGQVVLAFGSPLGLHNSVSLGVVSAIARQLEPESPMIYVQTDASINPGSSGGPLVDARGRLVGINTLIVSQAGGNDGLGFAAPSNIVKSVYEQIRANGYVRRGEIGVQGQTITPALAAGLGLARDHGAILADVTPRGPGDRAGLRVGDIVLSLDGKPIENGRQLHVSLYRRLAGDVVTLEVLRGDTVLKVPVAMTERPDGLAALSASMDPRQNLVTRLGILGIDLDARIAAMLPRLRATAGVVVASTVTGAIDSAEGGLAPGDVIYAVNRTAVRGIADVRRVLDSLKPGDAAVLHLDRNGVLIYLAFTLE